MKQPEAYIYRNIEFDGRIFVKVVGLPPEQQCEVTLHKDGQLHPQAPLSGKVVMFDDQDKGHYKATVTLTPQGDNLESLKPLEIEIKSSAKAKSQNLNPTTKDTKKVFSRIDGIKHYFLTVKLDSESSFGRLKRHALTAQSLLFKVRGQTDYRKFPSNKLLGDILPNLYYIDPHCEFDDLVNMAKELEKLDYVVYCTVSPDLKELLPPDLPSPMPQLPAKDNVDANSDTPDFVDLQKYLQDTNTVAGVYGMNVLQAFARMRYGQGATVRLFDGGIHSDHEDLKGNVTVLGIGDGPNARDHGTASAGCIAAINELNEGLPQTGVVGIASRSDFYFYSYDYLDELVVDSVPGDIVAINAQWYVEGKFIPLIDGRREWEIFKALTDNGVIVILAAGNGHLDLSEAAGNINQFGDSGSMLVGACNGYDGLRSSSSNYGHSTSLINSWGGAVVTLGYGDLQTRPGNDRNYTAEFNGTSSATPLCAGALASIQGYCISELGMCMDPDSVRDLFKFTGYTEAIGEGIGKRPDVLAAMKYLDGKV